MSTTYLQVVIFSLNKQFLYSGFIYEGMLKSLPQTGGNGKVW